MISTIYIYIYMYVYTKVRDNTSISNYVTYTSISTPSAANDGRGRTKTEEGVRGPLP